MEDTALQPAGLHIGTSGWSYKDWVGPFYPEGTAERDFLAIYARHFPTVEIDSTFYGIPRETTVQAWANTTPAGFLFAPKAPQVVTHQKMLIDAVGDMQEFVRALEPLLETGKLGPLLLQFPYGFKPEQFDDLAKFLPQLPSGPRYAVEVRHKGWLKERFYDLLREHGVALALLDHPWVPALEVTTAPFTYIRWLGDRERIQTFGEIQIDRSKEIGKWSGRVARLLEERVEVFGYVNNHYAGHSPSTARELLASVKDSS